MYILVGSRARRRGADDVEKFKILLGGNVYAYNENIEYLSDLLGTCCLGVSRAVKLGICVFATFEGYVQNLCRCCRGPPLGNLLNRGNIKYWANYSLISAAW